MGFIGRKRGLKTALDTHKSGGRGVETRPCAAKAATLLGMGSVLSIAGYFAVTGNVTGIAVVSTALVTTVLWAESN